MGMESKTAMEPKTGMESKTIWLNGEFVDYEKATLHFMTPGLHYGIGVFEGIRCYQTDRGPAIFRLDEHIARFFHSALCLGFRELPFGEEQIADACTELVARNSFDDCYIRPLLYLASGGSGGGWNLNLDGGSPAIGIAAWKWGAYLGRRGAREGGARERLILHTPPPERHDDEGQDQRQLCEQLPREDRVGAAGLR